MRDVAVVLLAAFFGAEVSMHKYADASLYFLKTGVRRGLERDVQRQRALGPVRNADRLPLLQGPRGTSV